MADLKSSEVAQRLGVAHSTVRVWCNRNLFPHARNVETPAGSYWLIPEEDLIDFKPPKRGRHPKSPVEKAA